MMVDVVGEIEAARVGKVEGVHDDEPRDAIYLSVTGRAAPIRIEATERSIGVLSEAIEALDGEQDTPAAAEAGGEQSVE